MFFLSLFYRCRCTLRIQLGSWQDEKNLFILILASSSIVVAAPVFSEFWIYFQCKIIRYLRLAEEESFRMSTGWQWLPLGGFQVTLSTTPRLLEWRQTLSSFFPDQSQFGVKAPYVFSLDTVETPPLNRRPSLPPGFSMGFSITAKSSEGGHLSLSVRGLSFRICQLYTGSCCGLSREQVLARLQSNDDTYCVFQGTYNKGISIMDVNAGVY